MTKSLQINNFQSHKHSELEFDPGVNIIIGSSDCGKTAITRALNWLINNRPLGDSFRSNWGGDTNVFVEVDDHSIGRVKQDKQGYYFLDEDEYKAFDKSVPVEIQGVLNFTEINLQRQLDAPFLLCETPGEVQRILNRIAHLDKIDDTMSNIEKSKRQVSSAFDSANDMIKSLESDLKKFADLDKIRSKIEKLKAKEKANEELKRKIPVLNSIIAKLNSNDIQMQRMKLLGSFENEIYDQIKKLEFYSELEEKKVSLHNLIFKIEVTDNKIDRKKAICENEKEVLTLIDKLKTREEKDKAAISLGTLLDKIEKTSMQQVIIMTDLNTKEEKFKEQFPDVCPLCGQEIKK